MLFLTSFLCIMNFFIVAYVPTKLIVELKGAAKDIHSSTGGIYILRSNQVNSKAHWIQNGGLNALWYDKDHGDWSIGDIGNLGSATVKIYSPDNSVGPLEATIWKYANNGEFIETTNLIILSVPGIFHNVL